MVTRESQLTKQVIGQIFGYHNRLRSYCLQAQPVNTLRFSFINFGYILFKTVGNFPAVVNLNRLILKLNRSMIGENRQLVRACPLDRAHTKQNI